MKKLSRKWIIFIITLGVLCLLAFVPFLWARHILAGSLPALEGSVVLPGLHGEVTVTRDSRGIPTLKGANRTDVACALGFLHGQERFFQMDLMRRRAAGELSELFGKAALQADRSARLHLLRRTAEKVVAAMGSSEHEILKAYVLGVNNGLGALKEKPFEYQLLKSDPVAWTETDSILVIHSMFMFLQDYTGSEERDLGIAKKMLGDDLFAFFCPQGTSWDAPLLGSAMETPPVPGPETINLRKKTTALNFDIVPSEHQNIPGSNNWAISGDKSQSGFAMVTNDMHLGIRVPNTWYYASLCWPGPEQNWCVTGVTLPGFPGVVVGSNQHVAWGFTNSYGDFCDIIDLKNPEGDEQTYMTPEGVKTIQIIDQTITVKGEDPEVLHLPWTCWGPIIGTNPEGRKQVVRWTGHDPQSINMGFLKLELSLTLEQAMDQANRTGIPAQNFTAVDDQGHIGWTIIGKIPGRYGFSGRVPEDWSDGTRGWNGYVDPSVYPRVVDPENHCIWTANARVVDAGNMSVLGDGGYDLGARSRQIRDDLLQTENATEKDMLRIQLDDRAIFLKPWQKLVLNEFDGHSDESIQEKEALGFIRNWGSRASVESVGYRIVRAFRYRVHAQLREAVFSTCYEAKHDFNPGRFGQMEGPVWRIISERPDHLLPGKYADWHAFFRDALSHVIGELTSDDKSLKDQTWGARNRADIKHPLSSSIPYSGSFLDMPHDELPGDSYMPRVQSISFGASMRMTVAPGHEDTGIFHMPCGQSGHPLSPFYRKGHQDWVKGNPTPFLPGKTLYKLQLLPAKGS